MKAETWQEQRDANAMALVRMAGFGSAALDDGLHCTVRPDRPDEVIVEWSSLGPRGQRVVARDGQSYVRTKMRTIVTVRHEEVGEVRP